MSNHEMFAGGVLRVRYDDQARTVTEWDADGVQVSQRAYTAGENAAADAAEAAEAESTNETALRDNITAGITAAIARRQSVQAAAADLAGDLDALGSLSLAAFKALGNRVVALANATAAGMGDTVALARLTVRALDSADTGD